MLINKQKHTMNIYIIVKKSIKKILLINLSIIIIFCVACDNNLYKETNSVQKETVIIGETDKNIMSEENTNIDNIGKYNESEVLVIIKKGYGDISKNKNELLKNAKIIFTFSDDDEKEVILQVKNENYTTEELIKKLKDLPEVISVEANYNLSVIHTN